MTTAPLIKNNPPPKTVRKIQVLQKGDDVYYYSRKHGIIPARILDVISDEKIKIIGKYSNGDRTTYVKIRNCYLYNKS